MGFKVKHIEFEFKGIMQAIRSIFLQCLHKYASKAVTEIESEYEDQKLIFKFNKSISLNTVNKALALLQDSTNIDIEEIEYNPKDAKVEVEVK